MTSVRRQEHIWLAWERFLAEVPFADLVLKNTMTGDTPLGIIFYEDGTYRAAPMPPRTTSNLPKDCIPLEVPHLRCDKSKGLAVLRKIAKQREKALIEGIVDVIHKEREAK
jgi:hypothetical protein